MINWRSAVTRLPGLSSSVRGGWQGVARPRWSPQQAARVQASIASGAQAPWTWSDFGWSLLWSAGLTAVGGLSFLLLKLCISLYFTFGEATGHVRPGSFDAMMSAISPYGASLNSLFIGCLLCFSILYGVYRGSLRKYRVPLSALFLRNAGWRTYTWIAGLFVPIALGGAVIANISTSLLGAPMQNPEFTMLTRGVSPLPGNAIVLFLLLTVVLPIAEETLFRAYLYRLLRREMPVWAAAGGSALVYAGAHGVPVLMPWLFFMGIAYALVVERTQSLWSAILLHAMINAIAALSLLAILFNW